MAQDSEQLRAQIDQQRHAITDTVDQIENRVTPSHVVARRRNRMRRRMTDWTDKIMGNDHDDPRQRSSSGAGSDRSVTDRARETTHEMRERSSEMIHEAPDMLRQRTKGNPLAVGLMAAGAGWLVASLLPESERESDLVHRMEPELEHAARAARGEADELVDDLREPAQEAAEHVKDRGREAAEHVKSEGTQSAR